MSFPYVLQSDCKKSTFYSCPDDEVKCTVCPPAPKCLVIDHDVIMASTPTSLGDVLKNTTNFALLFEPISYTLEISITNQFDYPIQIKHVFSALAASSLWSIKTVNQLPLLNEACTSRDVGACGELLAEFVCMQPCQTLTLQYSLEAKCQSACEIEGLLVGGATCALLNEKVTVYALNSCEDECTIDNKFTKTHVYTLPV